MIQIRLATPKDNEQLIALTASSGMSGEVALRIDRQPDFFRLLEMRGKSNVFVALDGPMIVGSLSVSQQQVYLGGEIHPLLYIGDLKIAKGYRNKGLGGQLCDEMANYATSIDADLAFLNVAKGNNKPFSFFKNRPGFPDFTNIGVFNIHQLIGKKQKRQLISNPIKSVEVTDELLAFFNVQHAKYELGNVITKEMLVGSELFSIQEGNMIVAAMCLTDTMHVKQNVVTQMSWSMKILLKAINHISEVAGISKMPALQTPVRLLYIKYLAVDQQDKKMVLAMINHARNIAYERSYSFASISLHEKDPLNRSIKGLLNLTFNSIGMLISLKDHKSLITTVTSGIPFEDYSLV